MSASSWRCLSRPCAQAAAAHKVLLRPHHHMLRNLIPPGRPKILRCGLAFSSPRRHLLTLAIETSCDDTCVAVLEKQHFSPGAAGGSAVARLLFNEKITSDNRDFRGVHPLTAVTSHTTHIAPLVRRALSALPVLAPAEGSQESQRRDDVVWVDGCARRKPDFVAVTRGPGMSSNLAVGLNTAKGLAVAWDVPLLAVNHMQAHALTPRLVSALARAGEDGNAAGAESHDDPAFPFLSLLVSGGHTLLVHSRALSSHAILAQAANIAIGDMLDKSARLIIPPAHLAAASAPRPGAAGAGTVMYGALLEHFVFPDYDSSSKDECGGYDNYGYTAPAQRADEIVPFDSGHGWTLTPPLSGTRAMEYDFSGFYSQVQRAVEDHIEPRYASASASGSGVIGAEARAVGPAELEERRLLGRHAMRLAFEHLVSRVLFALQDLRPAHRGGDGADKKGGGRSDSRGGDADGQQQIRTLVVAGGVASNRYLMHILRAMLAARGYGPDVIEVVAPPPALCTDNAAMIAWAAAEMYEAGWRSELDVLPLRKWPLDHEAEGGGILGADGWYKV